ncbi:MAG: hypothetical protein ACYDBB_17820 [Armatimonadota bacterium]
MSEELYTKIIVAHHSPKNRCHARNGDVLIALPRVVKALPTRKPVHYHVEHSFVSARDQSKQAVYGWVKEVAPFTIEEFIARYLPRQASDLSKDELEHISILLRAANRLPVDSVVVAEYWLRGVMEKRLVFVVRKEFSHFDF